MTLSELIQECGDDFRWLKKRGHGKDTVWLAQGRIHPIQGKDIRAIGKTPEEAVRTLLRVLQGIPALHKAIEEVLHDNSASGA